MNKRKEYEINNRRQYIISIAEQLFLSKGREFVTMDDIAKESDISKTTIYKYFKSKDELELLVYKRLHPIKMKFLKDRVEAEPNGLLKLKAFGEAYFDFFKENPTHLKFQLKQDYRGINKNNIREEVLNTFKTIFIEDEEYMDSIIKQGIDEKLIRPELDNVETLNIFYLTLRAVLNQIMILDKENNTETLSENAEKNYEFFLDIFIRGIST